MQNSDYTTIYVPKKLIEVWLVKYYDWKAFGSRINDNLDCFYSSKPGFYEFEVENHMVTHWTEEFKEQLGDCVYLHNVPTNVEF